MGNLIRNERLKLLANAFDRLSTALATVGAITPLATIVYGSGALGISPLASVIAAACWFMTAVALHLVGRQLLGGLKDDRL
jgi:hypothetical protein